MRLSYFHNRAILAIGIPILVILAACAVAPQILIESEPNALAFGIMVDVLLTAPIAFLILARKTRLPKILVLPILTTGVIAATLSIPDQYNDFLEDFAIWLFPAVELSILTFGVIKIRKAVRIYKEKRKVADDFYTALKAACQAMFPKPASMIFLTEISMIYYALFAWKKPQPKENEFTVHRNSGAQALFAALILILVVETFVLHILLMDWSPLLANILSILSIYTIIQIFGWLKSISRRFIILNEEGIQLSYGIMADAFVSYHEIDFVEVTSKDFDKESGIKRISPVGELDSHNVVIHFKNEQVISGIYGIRKRATKLALFVDEKTKFQSDIDQALLKF